MSEQGIDPQTATFSAECHDCHEKIRPKRNPIFRQLIQCAACEEIYVVTAVSPPKIMDIMSYAYQFYE